MLNTTILIISLMLINGKNPKADEQKTVFRPMLEFPHWIFHDNYYDESELSIEDRDESTKMIDSLERIAKLRNNHHQISLGVLLGNSFPEKKYRLIRFITENENITGLTIEYSDTLIFNTKENNYDTGYYTVYQMLVFWNKSNAIKNTDMLKQLYFLAPNIILKLISLNKQYKYHYNYLPKLITIYEKKKLQKV